MYRGTGLLPVAILEICSRDIPRISARSAWEPTIVLKRFTALTLLMLVTVPD